MTSARSIDLSELVDDRPDDGVFRVHSRIYTDPYLFELEQAHLFARTWNFLGLESQVSKAHDYLACRIGKTAVLLTRDAAGTLHAHRNACRHKGASLTRLESGNARQLPCPYHGWVYDSAGKCLSVKDARTGAYGAGFAQETHDLVPLPRLATYKGLIFGALSADVPPLEVTLGELRPLLDLAMDQGAEGMEFVPGRIAFQYRANWKLQLENGTDFYHLTSTHAAFMDVMNKRRAGEGNQEARQFDWHKRLQQRAGTFHFAYGHAAVWMDQAEAEKRPIYPVIQDIAQRVGATRAEWMLKVRGLSVFPNLQIADGASLTLRTFQPLAADLTEMRYYCLAPIGEPRERRAWRLRQFEDFFNVSGLATPDDVVIYEDCQRGFVTSPGWLQGTARGLGALQPHGNEVSAELAFTPLASVMGDFRMQNETTLHPAYREWVRLIETGLKGESSHA